MYEVSHISPVSLGATARFPYSVGLEASMQFTPLFSEEKVCMAVRSESGLFLDVPRNFASLKPQHDIRVQRNIGAINCKLKPRDTDQERVYAECLALLKTGRSFVCECPTGWGKTWLGTSLFCALGEATLIVVPKGDLMRQWRKTLLAQGIPESEIGLCQQKTCTFKGKRFVLAMVQSLINPEKYPSEFFNYFGAVIFDETHRMAADQFSTACTLFPAHLRLGLSAKSKRKDGKDPVIQGHIGEVRVCGIKVPMRPKILVKQTGWKMPQHDVFDPKQGRYIRQTIPHSPGKLGHIYKLMGKHPGRNTIIVDFVRQAYAAGRTVVIMSDLIDAHLKILFQLLGAHLPAEDFGYYISGMSDLELEQAAHRRVILATYGMCAEGTDYPHWDTLVMATPRSDPEQPVGRVIREMYGKRMPVVLDLVDGDSIFKGYALSREKYYFKVKSEIVRIT